MTDPKQIEKQETVSGIVNWTVEIYPWDSPKPSYGDFQGYKPSEQSPVSPFDPEDASPFALAFASQAAASLLQNSINTSEGLSHGIRSLNISRTKARPDAQCTFTYAGPLPEGLHVGSWAIVNSVSGVNVGQKSVTRFIGQIYDVQTAYAEGQDGLLTTMSQVHVREWSFALTSRVEYNAYSFIHHMAKSGQVAGLNAALIQTLDLEELPDPDSNDFKELTDKARKLLEQALDPFEYAQAVLTWIGMITEKDYLSSMANKDKDQIAKGLANFATTAPGVPPKVLQRLNLKDVDPTKAPFSGGFSRTITGMLQEPRFNDGAWNGVFPSDFPIESMRTKMKTGYEEVKEKKPSINGVAALSQASMTAWELLNKYSDNSFHEVYTDMWYEENDSVQGEIVGRPVIVIRDKPYTLGGIGSLPWVRSNSFFSIWSQYDHLPRINIKSSAITGFKVSSNCVNSPNYIRISPLTELYQGTDLNTFTAGVHGTTRLDPEMRRFGGNVAIVPTIFLAFNNKENDNEDQLLPWFATLNDVYRSWHAYDYRMARGILNIKDSNVILSVGFNAQFDVGDFNLVGHIDGYNISYSITQENLGVTNISVNLSKIVHVYKDNKLGFLNPSDFGNLLYAKPPLTFNLEHESELLALNTDSLPDVTGLV